MAKKKKFKAKQLKHDPFLDWFQRQTEKARQHRNAIYRNLITVGAAIAVGAAISLAYSSWTGVAERRLAEAFDIFNAQVGDAAPSSSLERSYTTEEEKYRAALEAYRRVSDAWYYRFSDHRQIARYYEGLCQLRLNSSEGQSILERLAQGDSTTARMARLALAEHLVGEEKAADAEKHYRRLTEDPGRLPKYQIQLGLARTLELQNKHEEATALYVEIARERPRELEGREAVDRLAELDPTALDQLPDESTSSPPPDPLARYTKK